MDVFLYRLDGSGTLQGTPKSARESMEQAKARVDQVCSNNKISDNKRFEQA
jgi:hypothetical protein